MQADDFAHHLYDTIILLGGKPEFAQMLLCQDLIDEAALSALRQYNIELQESLKDRFVNINKTEIATVSNDPNDLRYSFRTSLTC